jgi:hypothetical protein
LAQRSAHYVLKPIYLRDMQTLLITLCAGIFLTILFLNVYFRVKVFKVYKVLVQNRVEFGAAHIFNQQKLEEEILPKYPKQREAILQFVNNIRFSVKCASALIIVTTVLAASLMFFQD